MNSDCIYSFYTKQLKEYRVLLVLTLPSISFVGAFQPLYILCSVNLKENAEKKISYSQYKIRNIYASFNENTDNKKPKQE